MRYESTTEELKHEAPEPVNESPAEHVDESTTEELKLFVLIIAS
jgi:hypothetical protein